MYVLPSETELLGELLAELRARQVTRCRGMSEETPGIERSCLTQRVGAHVCNHDVLMKLGLERPIRVVPIRRGDHSPGWLLLALPADSEALSFDVGHSSLDARFDGIVDELAVFIGPNCVER